MAVVRPRVYEIEKGVDSDHIPARCWRAAARGMELLGMTSELEKRARMEYAEIIDVCEQAAASVGAGGANESALNTLLELGKKWEPPKDTGRFG